MNNSLLVNGFCDDRFKLVEQKFRSNFDAGLEIGSSLAVMIDGEMVVDLWGGLAQKDRTKYWEKDTIVSVFSTTKVITTLCILILVDRGLLDLNAPISQYWPEFGQNGKDKILIRHVLSHSAGIPGFTTQKVNLKMLANWDSIIHIIEAEKPSWTPGTKTGYHALTFGYILGELTKRVTGKTIGQFFHEEIAKPFQIEFYIGVPKEHDPQVAEILGMEKEITKTQLALWNLFFKKTVQMATNPWMFNTPDYNSLEWRYSEIPAGNGHGNARSLAQIGNILASGGLYENKRIVSQSMVKQAIEEQIRGRDAYVFYRPSVWGLGFGLFNKEMLLGRRSFYWGGLGGSFCIMDLEKKISIGYAMNRMAEMAEGDSRTIPLIKAIWASLAQIEKNHST